MSAGDAVMSEGSAELAVLGVQGRLTASISPKVPGGRGSTRGIRRAYGEKGGETKARQKMRCAFIPECVPCGCCGKPYLRRRPWQKACSRECQLVILAAEKFAKAYREGRADGMRGLVEELRK